MAGELKKKVLKREQATPAESEKVQKNGAETGKEGAPAEGKKGGAPPKLERKSQDGWSALPEGEAPNEGSPAGTRSWWKRPFTGKAAIFGLPALIVVLGAGLFFVKFNPNIPFHETREQTPEPVISIKRPVPIPDYREILDFFILNETDRQKTMVALRMEFTFHSPAAYQVFKDENVHFRDTVYSFLLRQNALRNTRPSWHTVVEKDLFEYLRVKLPQSKADQIRLTQVENL
jgi:hypothetical protein